MKSIVLLGLLFLTACSSAIQNNVKSNDVATQFKSDCNCASDSILSALIDCNKDTLSNGAMIYWNFNCDSSWLIFENNKGEKQLLFSLDSQLIYLTTRLGHAFYYEFDSSLLYVNKVISGCCEPVEYYWYDKENGKLIDSLGRAIFTGNDEEIPYFVGLKYTRYDNDSLVRNDSLMVLNLNSKKKYYLPIDGSWIDAAMQNGGPIYPEMALQNSVDENKKLTIKIVDDITKPNEASDLFHKIEIDFRKYP